MTSTKVPFNLTYHKPGICAPVYVAGTFTDPKWAPQEMRQLLDSDGEPTFGAQVHVVPGTEYQYRFRVGEHGSWVPDERGQIVLDDAGDRANLLRAPLSRGPDAGLKDEAHGFSRFPSSIAPKPTETLAAKLASELEVQAEDGRTGTPIAQVAATAAEVADTAQLLDQDLEFDDSPEYSTSKNDSYGHHGDFKTPLFAHESFGAYEFVDDGLDHDLPGASTQRRFSKSIKDCYTNDVDTNDPTLEKFPSDKLSILDTIRKIQSTLDDDGVHADGLLASPYEGSSRASVDSTDESGVSPGSLSPTSTRRRDSRQSHNSFVRSKSAVSLGSIAEEEHQKIPAGTKSNPLGLSRSHAKDDNQTDGFSGSWKSEDDSWLTNDPSMFGGLSMRHEEKPKKRSNLAQPGGQSVEVGTTRTMNV